MTAENKSVEFSPGLSKFNADYLNEVVEKYEEALGMIASGQYDANICKAIAKIALENELPDFTIFHPELK